MSRSQPHAVALLLVLIGTAGSLAGQQRLTIDDFVGDWSANIAGTQWDLLFEEQRQYSIWRVTAEGDTLALSLGVWDFDGTRICVTPIGRSALCDAARIDNPRQPAMTEWRFQAIVQRFQIQLGWKLDRIFRPFQLDLSGCQSDPDKLEFA